MSFAGLLLKSLVLSIIRVLNKTNNGRSDVFYIMHGSLQRPDTPRCCLGQLGLKSAGFGLMPEICRERLHVSGRPLKGIEKKRLAVSQKCPEIAQITRTRTHTRTHHFCHSHLSFLPSLSLCGPQIDKKTSILKPRDKQLIIYAVVATT